MMRFAVRMMKKEMADAAIAAGNSTPSFEVSPSKGASDQAGDAVKPRQPKRPKPSKLNIAWKGVKATVKLLALPPDPVSAVKHETPMKHDGAVPARYTTDIAHMHAPC
jgi:hypothetical protein